MNRIADDFIKDVASGMRDQDLEKKYGISGKKLMLSKAAARDIIAQRGLQRNPIRRKVKAQELLRDVQANLDDDALMEKYVLTRRELQSALRQLIRLGLATPLELSKRLSITESQVAEAFEEMGKAIKELD